MGFLINPKRGCHFPAVPFCLFLFIFVYICLFFCFFQCYFHNRIPGIWKRVAVAGVSVEEEELILGVFLQVPVIRKLYLGIVGKTAEFFDLTVNSGKRDCSWGSITWA